MLQGKNLLEILQIGGRPEARRRRSPAFCRKAWSPAAAIGCQMPAGLIALHSLAGTRYPSGSPQNPPTDSIDETLILPKSRAQLFSYGEPVPKVGLFYDCAFRPDARGRSCGTTGGGASEDRSIHRRDSMDDDTSSLLSSRRRCTPRAMPLLAVEPLSAGSAAGAF